MKYPLFSRYTDITGWIICLLFASALTAIMYYISRSPLVGVDDANIYFVYARNFVNGHGFVYNIGSEHVEGFSATLWVFVCALGFLITNTPEFLILCFNVICVTALIFFYLHFFRNKFAKLFNDPSFTFKVLFWGFLFALAFELPFWFWTTISLMEPALWALIINGSMFVLLNFIHMDEKMKASKIRRYAIGCSFMVVLAVLGRPEGLAWGLIIPTLFLANVYLTKTREKRQLLCCIIPYFAYFVTTGILVAWRLYYFGYPLPNPYYAKVSSDIWYNINNGLLYAFDFVQGNYYIPLIIWFLNVWGWFYVYRRWKRNGSLESIDCAYLTFSFFLFCPVAFNIYKGGDHFEGYRFLQTTWPMLFLALGYFVALSKQTVDRIVIFSLGRLRPYVYGFLLGLVFVAGILVWVNWYKRDPFIIRLSQQGRVAGVFLESLFKDRKEGLPTLGIIPAGGYKYGYSGMVYDLIGLNLTSIAHNGASHKGEWHHAAFEQKDFYRLKPEMLSPRIVIGEPKSWTIAITKKFFVNRYLKNLALHKRFWDNYRFVYIRQKNMQASYNASDITNTFGIMVFLRKDLYEELKKRDDVVMTNIKVVFPEGLYMEDPVPEISQ